MPPSEQPARGRAQLTAAGAVIARRPATTPIREARAPSPSGWGPWPDSRWDGGHGPAASRQAEPRDQGHCGVIRIRKEVGIIERARIARMLDVPTIGAMGRSPHGGNDGADGVVTKIDVDRTGVVGLSELEPLDGMPSSLALRWSSSQSLRGSSGRSPPSRPICLPHQHVIAVDCRLTLRRDRPKLPLLPACSTTARLDAWGGTMASQGLQIRIGMLAAVALVVLGAFSVAGAEDGPVCRLRRASLLARRERGRAANRFLPKCPPLHEGRAAARARVDVRSRDRHVAVHVLGADDRRGPDNQRIIAVAQFTTIQVSFDGGGDLHVSVNAPATSPSGDPARVRQPGAAVITYLCSPGAGRDVCISGYTCNAGRAPCALLPGAWPVNVSVGGGDRRAQRRQGVAGRGLERASAFADRLYVVWTRLDTNPWSIWTTLVGRRPELERRPADLRQRRGTVWPSHSRSGHRRRLRGLALADRLPRPRREGTRPTASRARSCCGARTTAALNWQARSFPYARGPVRT